ncbi:MAG: O-acetyl-ADP-ribose deacetylase [Micromonosporaceae bacterium]|nr:O-acetyl-ADP-ribose deacetylase [Micromonosporaceae bacterium]
MAEILVVQGDITKQAVDAIVTAANSSLSGGGGVDWAVHRAAGRRLAEAGRALGPCPTGEAVATPAFELDPPIRYVIHAVGPVWRGGDRDEPDLLASCYRRSLEVADELGLVSIAFPAISTGAFGFPPERAAPIAVRTLRATPTRVRLVKLVAFDGYTERLLTQALAG